MNHRRIVITGFMASGKTSLANALAQRLKCDAVDLDEEITMTSGRTPSEIIIQDGEQTFRRIETDTLRQVLTRGARVVALGGGAWTISTNRDLIKELNCLTVWLDVPFETCWNRISVGGKRPLAPNQQQARALYEARRPFYELAHIRVEADKTMDVTELARLVEFELDAGR